MPTRPVIALCAIAYAAAGAAPPKTGLKTPGVQIPIEKLSPEAVYQAAALPSDLPLERKQPCGAVRAFGSIWAPACDGRQLSQLDAKSGKVIAQFPLASGPIAASADSLWMLADTKTTLVRVDPESHQIVSEMRLPAACSGLVFGESSLWVACPGENRVARINPATSLVDKWIPVSAAPKAIAIGEGAVWVLCTRDGKVERIDPATNKIAKSIDLAVPGANGAIAVGEGSVWVTLSGFPLIRIKPQSEQVVQQFYGSGGGAVATGGGFVWLSNTASGSLWKIDPRRVAATLAE